MRTWPGLAALGAGLIHLGIAAGSAAPLLAVLVVVGAAECGWGVAALAGDRPPLPGRALPAVALVVAAQVVVLLTGGHAHTRGAAASGWPYGAIAGAAALDLAVAVLLALRLRRGSGRRREAGALRFLLATAAAAGLVAVVVTSSLAATVVGGGHVH